MTIVARVVARGVAHHDRRLTRQKVYDSTLAFIAPLPTNRHDCRHLCALQLRRSANSGQHHNSFERARHDGEMEDHRDPQASVARSTDPIRRPDAGGNLQP